MHKILFVCMGNICRSPAAEGIFRKLVSDAGRGDEFDIDSAGTGEWHIGHAADSRMREAARERGYVLDSIARQIEQDDFHRFDWIITMDDLNYQHVRAMDPGARAQIVSMCTYCESHDESEVPDPYYGGEAGFQKVIDILEDACANLLRNL